MLLISYIKNTYISAVVIDLQFARANHNKPPEKRLVLKRQLSKTAQVEE